MHIESKSVFTETLCKQHKHDEHPHIPREARREKVGALYSVYTRFYSRATEYIIVDLAPKYNPTMCTKIILMVLVINYYLKGLGYTWTCMV